MQTESGKVVRWGCPRALPPYSQGRGARASRPLCASGHHYGANRWASAWAQSGPAGRAPGQCPNTPGVPLSPRGTSGERTHGPPTAAISAPEPVAAVAALCERRVAAAFARRMPRSAVTDRRYRFMERAGERGGSWDRRPASPRPSPPTEGGEGVHRQASGAALSEL